MSYHSPSLGIQPPLSPKRSKRPQRVKVAVFTGYHSPSHLFFRLQASSVLPLSNMAVNTVNARNIKCFACPQIHLLHILYACYHTYSSCIKLRVSTCFSSDPTLVSYSHLMQRAAGELLHWDEMKLSCIEDKQL